MKNYYKIVGSYPQTYQGKAPLDNTWKEFTVDEDGVYSPVELNDAIVALEVKEANENQLAKAKQYLLDTDWVVVKINEAQLLGQDIQPLLTKYSVELGEREAKRTIINSLEG